MKLFQHILREVQLRLQELQLTLMEMSRNATTPDIGADEFDGFTFEDPLPAGTYTVGTGGQLRNNSALF